MSTERTERSWVEINLDHYRANIEQIKQHLNPEQGFMQIVKADAYGHGALEISKVAIDLGALYLGVANMEEGKLLRLQGIKAPILVLSPAIKSEISQIIEYELTPTVSDLEFANALDSFAAERNLLVPIHVKIDTGMHRSGLSYELAFQGYQKITQLRHLEVEGIFSHFASSESDENYTGTQLAKFQEFISLLNSLPRYIHIANSSGVLSHNDPCTNLVRLGILSYGIYTNPIQAKLIRLLPVMTFKSICRGETLGYNRTWTAPHDTTYAIIPVGYADGYDFMLSNRATVVIQNKSYPVVGRISMDMITVDLKADPLMSVGTEVTLLGGSESKTSAEELSGLFAGSAYELLCQIGRRAKRYYFSDGHLISSSPLSRRDFVSSDFSDSKLNTIIESAISQRLQNEEIGEMIYREILRSFFYNKDRDVHYRSNFVHNIALQSPINSYYPTITSLSYSKVLQNDYFIVACANSDEVLQPYFKRNDVEYRWLMDANFELSPHHFKLSTVSVNGIALTTQITRLLDCIEIKCSHPSLTQLIGSEVDFLIETETLYPVSSHQLSIFITELTRGVKVHFCYPPEVNNVEITPIFSGQSKFPMISHTEHDIYLETKVDQWVFPMSGIVFSY